MVQIYVFLFRPLAGGRQLACNTPELHATMRRCVVHEKIFTNQVLLSATASVDADLEVIQHTADLVGSALFNAVGDAVGSAGKDCHGAFKLKETGFFMLCRF